MRGRVPGILLRINVTARGKGSGDAWSVSVRDQLEGSPKATRLDLLGREERRENQTYWKAKIGYNMRWVLHVCKLARPDALLERLMERLDVPVLLRRVDVDVF